MSSLAALAIGTMFVLSPAAVWHDGDTAWTPDGTVRLWAVNAVECPVYHSHKRPCQDAATQLVTGLTSGETVLCVVRGDDGGDRITAECQADGIDIGDALMHAGYGCRDRRFDPFDRYGDEGRECE